MPNCMQILLVSVAELSVEIVNMSVLVPFPYVLSVRTRWEILWLEKR